MLLYNSKTRKKELFTPFSDKKILIYVCGITPYDTTHLGHAFTYITYDVLIRYLQYKGYDVQYTQNITDVDDDILKKARSEKWDWQKLGNYWTKKFTDDMEALNVQPPTHYVKATSAIDTIITMVKELKDKDYAYENEGNVYFSVKKFKTYGQLSHLPAKEMITLSRERGANPEDPLKQDPLDFILWQKSLPDEPFWESPWGKGRPGWHIECSAMNYKYLGEQIDIHGGGHDLIFPHHESEIAQSESFTGKIPFTKYWMHTAMLRYKGEKMSKSLGNLVMVSDLLEEYSPNTIRYMLLSHHYRSSWEHHESELKEAEKAVTLLNDALKVKLQEGNEPDTSTQKEQFEQYMEDDLDIPSALDIAKGMAEKIISRKEKDNNSLQANLRSILSILGFDFA